MEILPPKVVGNAFVLEYFMEELGWFIGWKIVLYCKYLNSPAVDELTRSLF